METLQLRFTPYRSRLGVQTPGASSIFDTVENYRYFKISRFLNPQS
jgi:hypothetical protein